MQAQSPVPSIPDKSALRRQLRAVRKAVPEGVRRRAGKALVRHALRNRLLASGKQIGFYMPANGEIDVIPLLNRAHAMGVRCYLPIVPGRGQRKLWFSRLDHQLLRPRHWRLNRFGIPEYHAPCVQRVRGTWLRQIFMPLLGFDRRGYRIGMGGGYYDASMAFRARRKAWHTPRLIGVAFSVQEVVCIPRDPWDVPLDGVLTDQGLLRPASRISSDNRPGW